VVPRAARSRAASRGVATCSASGALSAQSMFRRNVIRIERSRDAVGARAAFFKMGDP